MKKSIKLFAILSAAIMAISCNKQTPDTAPYEKTECAISFSCNSDLLLVADVSLTLTDFSGKTNTYAVRSTSQNFIVETPSSKLPAGISYRFDVISKKAELKKQDYTLGLNFKIDTKAYNTNGRIMKSLYETETENTTVGSNYVEAILTTLSSLHNGKITVSDDGNGGVQIVSE